MSEICCIGHITRDRIITPSATAEMAGGTAYYFAWAMHHLDPSYPFKIITKVGDDSVAEIERLSAAGIDVDNLHSQHTVFFENIYGDNPNDRHQRVLATADAFTAAELENVDATIFHLGTLLSDDISMDAIALLAQKGQVSIDVQGYLRQLMGSQVTPINLDRNVSLLEMASIIKLNQEEMQMITGTADPYKAGPQLAAHGAHTVVMTLGSYGSIIYAGGDFYEVPAYSPHRIVDVTGCGDTYMAGYLYGRVHGMPYQEAGKIAAAMCTLKIEHSGTFCGSMDDVEKVISGCR